MVGNPLAFDLTIDQVIVTAQQMRQIEERLFAAGMPVAALMEKVAGRISQWFQAAYPPTAYPRVGVLVGPGHNGGDALVVARELHFRGYRVGVYNPFSRLKELTASHAQYAVSLGIPFSTDLDVLAEWDVWIDGLFGFGLERSLDAPLAEAIQRLNHWPQPVVSIDLPSGIHTDTGSVMGTAVRATQTLCLGLWKRAFFQESALPWVGQSTLLEFDIPLADVLAVLGTSPAVLRLARSPLVSGLPLPRPAVTHKYRVGHLLLVVGSRRYGGAAILAGRGARASGVGMVTLAVPELLQPVIQAQLPEALVWGCPVTAAGAIATLPEDLDLTQFDAIACGPGLTPTTGDLLPPLLQSPVPLVLDADALNQLAAQAMGETVGHRSAPTVLTPHAGEFRRLFPSLAQAPLDMGAAAQTAAHQSQAIVVFKGARTVVASPQGQRWHLPTSTPALARGGSGDVLTGLIGGLLAQQLRQHPATPQTAALKAALAGVGWHAAAAEAAAQARTVLGVDPLTLAEYLPHSLNSILTNDEET